MRFELDTTSVKNSKTIRDFIVQEVNNDKKIERTGQKWTHAKLRAATLNSCPGGGIYACS